MGKQHNLSLSLRELNFFFGILRKKRFLNKKSAHGIWLGKIGNLLNDSYLRFLIIMGGKKLLHIITCISL